MPRYLLDIASYQGVITLADVQRAGFTAVNIKTSHGLGQTSVHPRAAAYAAEATGRGLGVATFHWLIGNVPGADQARYAYSRLRALGVDKTAAHIVDVEETADADTETPPTWQTIADYIATMRGLLRRPVMLYTGRWWWVAAGRNWHGASLTPYLHAAPNTGYPGSYPGDDSTHWNAGYGGWKTLTVMQYAVGPMTFPDGTKGSVNVSKSVIKDQAAWRALTTPTPEDDLVTTQAEFNTLMSTYLATPAGVAAHSAVVSTAVGPLVGALSQQLEQSLGALATALEEVPEDVAEELVRGTDTEVAGRLRRILGDRAPAIGQLLAGEAQP